MTITTQLLRDLVQLPSVNPMGRQWPSEDLLYEHRITAYLEVFFRDLGLPCQRQRVGPLRENLIARYDSAGAPSTLLLEVHQDTVPTDAMTIEPFAGDVRNGKLYGRGACDVKGGMAAMLTVMRRLARERPGSAINVIMACTVDEEHTFLGVQELMKLKLGADLAVVAEPTNLQIVNAHKGLVRWKVRTSGRACHSSRPDQGINAIYRMGRLLPAIEEYAASLLSSRIDPRLGTGTLSVGRIEGGTSVNTVPDFCVIEVDRRLLPGEDVHDAYADFERWLRRRPALDVPFTCDAIWLSCPALNPGGSEAISRKLGAAIDSVRGSHEILAVPFGTDASTIAEGGIPAVVFGPGDIAQAHTCDEWVELEQVEQAAEILYRLATHS
jgi:acetylornithine deacetylase/succinyl-diaminopimelate desuccinylase family protein